MESIGNSVFDKICLLVSDFNYLFGVINYKYNPECSNTLLELFDKSSKTFNEKQVRLRYELIKEEFEELKTACANLDSIEIVDALCDILYVIAGAIVYFDLSNSNVNMLLEQKGLVITEKIEFNERTVESIRHILLLQNDLISNIFYKIDNYMEELNILTNKFINNTELFEIENTIEYSKLLDKIIVNIFDISSIFNLNIYDLFVIVHESNMSKVCDSEELAIESVEWYKKNELRYTSPTFREIDYNNKKYYVVYDNETKKILKSIRWKQVKFY